MLNVTFLPGLATCAEHDHRLSLAQEIHAGAQSMMDAHLVQPNTRLFGVSCRGAG